MFRKPKRSAKASLRKRGRTSNDDNNDNPSENQGNDESETSSNTFETKQLLEKRQKLGYKKETKKGNLLENGNPNKNSSSQIIHQYQSSASNIPSAKDLATREAEYHPVSSSSSSSSAIEKESDKSKNKNNVKDNNSNEDTTQSKKIYKGAKESQLRNKFLAGPLKAPTFVRTTCRFDYQPDICKDYKETGFCGFGDTCIYLHDRGDTLTGWQLEQQWEERKKKEMEAKEKEMNRFIQSTNKQMNRRNDEIQGDDNYDDNDGASSRNNMGAGDDGIPYACHICRNAFQDPIVTKCSHYFCETCIMKAYKSNPSCPICGQDTNGVFNFPTKLIAKKKKMVGARKGWDDYFNSLQKSVDATSN